MARLGVMMLFCLLSAYALDPDYEKVPGTVSVLRGGPALLSFRPTLPYDQIYWCYWIHKRCQTCPVDRFLGYTIVGKDARENISPRQEGWEFENATHPCHGGIRRSAVRDMDEGLYQMIVEDMDRKEILSQFYPLEFYDEADLTMNVTVGSDTQSVKLSDHHDQALTLPERTGNLHKLELTLSESFPAAASLNVSKVSSSGKVHVTDCISAHDRSCQLDVVLEDEKDARVLAAVHPGIQGYPAIEIVQPLSHDGTSENVAAIVFAVLFALLFAALIIVGLFVIRPWYKKKVKKDEEVQRDEEKAQLLKKDTEVNELRSELDNANATIKQKDLDLAAKETDYENMKEDWKQKEEECKKLKGENKRLEDQTKSLKWEKKSLQTDLESNIPKLKEAERKITNLEGLLDQQPPSFSEAPEDCACAVGQQAEVRARVVCRLTPTVKLLREKGIGFFKSKEVMSVNDMSILGMILKYSEHDDGLVTLTIVRVDERLKGKYYIQATNKFNKSAQSGFNITIQKAKPAQKASLVATEVTEDVPAVVKETPSTEGEVTAPGTDRSSRSLDTAEITKEGEETPGSEGTPAETMATVPTPTQDPSTGPVFVQDPDDILIPLRGSNPKEGKLPHPEVSGAKIKSDTKPEITILKNDKKLTGGGISTDCKKYGDSWLVKLTVKDYKEKYLGSYTLQVKNKQGARQRDFRIKLDTDDRRSSSSSPSARSASSKSPSDDTSTFQESATADAASGKEGETADTPGETDNHESKAQPGDDNPPDVKEELGFVEELKDLEIEQHSSPVELRVKVEGKKPFKARWYKDRRETFAGGSIKIDQPDDNEFTLRNTGIYDNTGTYRCEVIDADGKRITSEARVSRRPYRSHRYQQPTAGLYGH